METEKANRKKQECLVAATNTENVKLSLLKIKLFKNSQTAN
jgi:hypothetical protein